jgi:hypothetical protein
VSSELHMEVTLAVLLFVPFENLGQHQQSVNKYTKVSSEHSMDRGLEFGYTVNSRLSGVKWGEEGHR